MRKKFQLKDNLLIQVPCLFKKQQLTKKQQLRDKQIRKQLRLLEQKRTLDQQLELKWKQQNRQIQTLQKTLQKKDAQLHQQQVFLSNDLFKLQIRKQQILSRKDPSINKSKHQTLMKYLKCLPYADEKRLHNISIWGGEEKYFRTKFCMQFATNRFLKKSQIDQKIGNSLNKIVLCRKVRFEQQLFMLIVKQINSFEMSHIKSKNVLSPSISFSEVAYSIQLFSLKGQNIVIKKQYTAKQLVDWTSKFEVSKEVKNMRSRVSVALNLINQQQLLEFQAQVEQLNNNPITTGSQFSSEQTQKKYTALTFNNRTLQFDSKDNNLLAEVMNQTESQQTQNVSSYQKESLYSSESEQSDSQSLDNKSVQYSRKTARSRSSFYPKSQVIKLTCKTLNKPFLNGKQAILFPSSYPLKNIVALINKRSLYMLPQYLQHSQKCQVIKNVIFRMKSKVTLNRHLNRCLFYRSLPINQFYQTKLSQSCQKDNLVLLNQLSLRLFFMIKESQQNQIQTLKISVISLNQHPQLRTPLCFESELLSERSHLQEAKDEKGRRVSKNIGKNASRRSKNNNKNCLKGSVQKHQKSIFHSKDKYTRFSAALVEKFESFISSHTISLVNRCFYPHSFVVSALQNIIKVQARLKQIYQRIKYKSVGQKRIIFFKQLPQSKIFISSLSIPQSVECQIAIQSLEHGRSSQTSYLKFSRQYQDIVKAEIESFDLQASIVQVRNTLQSRINSSIEKDKEKKARLQKERPEKNKRLMKRFFYMYFLRLKAKEHIFFIKKIAVKDRLFVLIIRRDNKFRQVLECSLYDLGLKLQTGLSKDGGSEIGWQKQLSHNSNKQFGKPYTYQHIYLQQKYFRNIDRKSIPQQFFIDYRTFLLKPSKGSNIYYIQRLASLDINSEQIAKAFISIDKQYSSKQNSFPLSSKSIKYLINGSYPKKQNPLFGNSQMNSIAKSRKSNPTQQSTGNLKGPNKLPRQKKNSIQSQQGNFLGLIKPSAIRQYQPAIYSKASLAQSTSNRRQGCKIQGNSHESILYYSLFKGSDVFFYLDIYIVTRKNSQKSYTESLNRLHRQRLYKKQLEDKGNDLVTRKIAEWLIDHEGEYVVSRDYRNIDENQSQMLLEEGLSMIGGYLQKIEKSGKQRFSVEGQKNIFPPIQQKPTRTNTLTL